MGHIESREAQYRGCEELEILIQLQLAEGLRPESVVERLKLAGMAVEEVACTIPENINEASDGRRFEDPGIDGMQ